MLHADSARFHSYQKGTAVVNAPMEAQPEDATQAQEQHINWWQKVESSYGNDKPDAELPENYRAGSYVPQHLVARQHLTHTD